LNASGGGKKTRLWASDSNRVIDTARYFSAGFFGLDWQAAATLQIIPETADLGADTLTPGDTCPRYRTDALHGHDYGLAQLLRFRATYLPAVADRLAAQNPHLHRFRFTVAELYSMQEMCGFETLVRGSSAWCDVFTRAEWRGFAYARDVIHFYRAGPGNPYGPAMGWLWLNATANLLEAGPEAAGPLFFSFVHDGDVVPMLAALELFRDERDLPVARVWEGRRWRTSAVVPMGGRVLFERLACGSSSSSSASASSSSTTPIRGEEEGEGEGEERRFVRVIVNDGVVALSGCRDGPGESCPLERFLAFVKRRGEEVGDFREVCGLGPDAADRITFLHQ